MFYNSCYQVCNGLLDVLVMDSRSPKNRIHAASYVLRVLGKDLDLHNGALFDVLRISAGPAGSCGVGAGSGSGSAVTASSVIIGSSVMMASSGLSGSLKSCSATASLSLSCMMGCCCCCSSWFLLLLLVFSSHASPLTPSCPPAIVLRVGTLTIAVVVLVLPPAVVVLISFRILLELLSYSLEFFYRFFHHLGGGIIPFVPSLLLRDDGIQFFLFFLYLLLPHFKLLLLHMVVAHPE
jgi:hypothetical protein